MRAAEIHSQGTGSGPFSRVIDVRRDSQCSPVQTGPDPTLVQAPDRLMVGGVERLDRVVLDAAAGERESESAQT